MKCKLGPKKHARCEQYAGKKFDYCLVRGGWDHYWSLCITREPYTELWVNYKTGEIKRAATVAELMARHEQEREEKIRREADMP